MFDLSRGRAPGSGVIAGSGVPNTLAENHARGLDGFSGMVPVGSPVTTDPDQGGRYDDTGRHEVLTNPQPVSDLTPIPGVVTRPMLGGVRTAHHANLLQDAPAFDGSHVTLANRVSVMVLKPTEVISDDPEPQLPSLRVPPVSDPYGRMCTNAHAAAARSGSR